MRRINDTLRNKFFLSELEDELQDYKYQIDGKMSITELNKEYFYPTKVQIMELAMNIYIQDESI
jgi:hypothetical protein